MAEDWDHVGLSVGDRNGEVDRVLLALDLEMEVIEEARRRGAGLILTHHPLLFHPCYEVTGDTREGAMVLRLAQLGMATAAYHTNLDRVEGGVNCVLAQTLGLTEVLPLPGFPMARLGTWQEGSFPALLQQVRQRLEAPWVRIAGRAAPHARQVAVCGGAGGDALHAAAQAGAEVLITGELKYHEAQQAAYLGLTAVEAGHYHTEHPVMEAMASHLQKRAHALQCKVEFICAQTVTCPYGVGV